MARISGINLPDAKRVVIGLTYIKGIGKAASQKILKALDIDESKRIKDLTEAEVNDIRKEIEKQGIAVEGDLVRLVLGNIKRLKEISTWRGMRHSKRLPLRGQRTKTNSRTIRGNVRRTAASGKISVQKT